MNVVKELIVLSSKEKSTAFILYFVLLFFKPQVSCYGSKTENTIKNVFLLKEGMGVDTKMAAS